jgi:hypothetical protein
MKFYWNWKLHWKELELLEDADLPMFYVHWKFPIKIHWLLDIVLETSNTSNTKIGNFDDHKFSSLSRNNENKKI